MALFAVPAIEELSSLSGTKIPLQAAVPGHFRRVFCSACGNERGSRLEVLPAAGLLSLNPQKLDLLLVFNNSF